MDHLSLPAATVGILAPALQTGTVSQDATTKVVLCGLCGIHGTRFRCDVRYGHVPDTVVLEHVNVNMDALMQSMQALPQWVQIWIMVLAVVNTLSLFFLRHAAGRLVFVVWLIVIGVNAWLMMKYGGFTRAMSFVHLLWIPMILWLGGMRRRESDTGLLRSWLVVLVLVNCISLAFDALEIVRWLAGARGLMGA